MDDYAFNLENCISKELTRRIGVAEEVAFLTRNNKPESVLRLLRTTAAANRYWDIMWKIGTMVDVDSISQRFFRLTEHLAAS